MPMSPTCHPQEWLVRLLHRDQPGSRRHSDMFLRIAHAAYNLSRSELLQEGITRALREGQGAYRFGRLFRMAELDVADTC